MHECQNLHVVYPSFHLFEGLKEEVAEVVISNRCVSIQLSPIYNCQKIQERTKLRRSEIISRPN